MISLNRIKLEHPIEVFDITVDQAHSFFANGIVVHNCQEIALPTEPYDSVTGLYDADNRIGEVGMCALSAINVARTNPSEYEDVAYYALLMIDCAITQSHYPLPQIGVLANKRRSAGVGIVGLAELMATQKCSYNTQAGRNFIHRLFEQHYYYLTLANIRLAKEFGRADWGYLTNQEWLPIDTYNTNVDELVTIGNRYDWESVREQIQDYGRRCSVVSAMMPAESSAIAGGSTNGVYPIRDKSLLKTNGDYVLPYVVPHSESLDYETWWDVDTLDMIKCYAIMQKWTDQGISADLWVDLSGDKQISTTRLLQEFFAMVKYGMKTRYYYHNKTSKDLAKVEQDDCESCKL